jgi:uncharacterized protein (UPF0548 family)
MQRRQSFGKRWSTAIRWPLGIALTSSRYMWRTTAVHRWEMTGSMCADAAPELRKGVARHGIQMIEDGEGPFMRRLYRIRIVGSSLTPEELMAQITEDLDRVAPSEFATFQKIDGDGPLAVGDEYLVRMPGPWDGPVRVVAATPTSFRLATLTGHLEAGQIEFRAGSDHRSLGFEIESWARSGDRFADALYSHLRLAKEIQLHMWTSVLERISRLAGGRREGGIAITTRHIDVDRLASPPLESSDARLPRKLTALAERAVNFDTAQVGEYTPGNGWHRDDMVETLPHEGSGLPAAAGSWHIARRLMVDYQLADPRVVRAVYRRDAPLAGRDILLKIRFAGMRFNVGVRVGEVYDETRQLDGREAQVFGWYYQTLEGHFEEGRMHYELWKWLDTGDVEFRLHAFSRAAQTGPFVLRTGFRFFGRTHQLRFYRQICRRARRLTEAELETKASSRLR